MHGAGRQGLECGPVHAGKSGTAAQAIDSEARAVRTARLFFFQCHASLAAAQESFLSRSFDTVVFSHGKESGPWGTKINAMAAVARDLSVGVESVDYRGIDDPGERVQKLMSAGLEFAQPLVLVGSSMGGHVSAAAATPLRARA
jgi:hypothetical protein